MEQGYRKVFWGFLIVLFNINIGPINILPDFLGYFIIGSGLVAIVNEFETKSFRIAHKTANLLFLYTLLLSIFNFIGSGEIIGNSSGYQYKIIIDIGLSVLSSIFSLYMAFHILSGTINLYLNRAQKLQAELLVKSQRSYTLLLLIGIILISISFNISSGVYMAITSIYVLLVQIYFATIISGIRKDFSGDLNEL
ncbi:hypothetical protein J2Z76_003105 [Sedimentibacter acidaminivorans]|uniref:Uncharacterized protein n=1 Tax=Sedimentibacter acidaminivorans TaxID=913099 RepID=A0ABS4GHM2_9FIRM|nr:hypothetical protein [Sedimentibacter acidaminivorans]MBP1927208.1 hypothetical protein [Sedimentibacter acidaminivorans]